MPTAVGPNTKGEENLVFGYDLGDVINSYKGQPTTNNFGGSFRDFSGTGYSPNGEWISSEPTRFTKTYFANLPTPIGPGGTLIAESGVNGFHHLSRYGGSEENGLHSLSCYIYPLATGITDFCIGMLADGNNNIQFNLDTRAITYGGGISNRNAFIRDVPGFPGWLRVGANIEGRSGGWVGCLGYSSYTAYTGTSGAKKAYITGIQYEYKTQPTPFTEGTRSATQGLLDHTGNSTIDLTNVSFDSNAQMTFDGTDDQIAISDVGGNLTNFGVTFEVVWKQNSINTSSAFGDIVSPLQLGIRDLGVGPTLYFQLRTSVVQLRWQRAANDAIISPSTSQESGVYGVYVGVLTSSGVSLYKNGVLVGTTAHTKTFLPWYDDTIKIGNNAYNTYFDGEVPIAKIYNRALTASEIKSNFNAIKGRFNI